MKCENEFEKKWWSEGRQYIVGIDEAGRGPIAGPLVVAAVCFPAGYDDEEIFDSKKISEKKRNALFKRIIEDALEYHIVIKDCKYIDDLNIYRATQSSMLELTKQFQHIDGVLTDAMPLIGCEHDVLPIVKGDAKSVSIAAASILAKVVRDHIMYGLDHRYPQYGFKKHKGYPTKAHLEAMRTYGVIEGFYRRSYGPVAQMYEQQLSLFDEE